MLNYLWGFMIILGIGFGIITGEVEALSNTAVDSSGEAVSLAITMLGIMAMWTGLIEVARRAELLDIMTKKLNPVINFLFPGIPDNHKAKEYITANIIANILGLGWAATPMGLKAMKEMAVINREKINKKIDYIRNDRSIKEEVREKKIKRLREQFTKASDEMCTFLVINISSLQVIPVSVIAYRSQYGSVNPVAIVVPGLIATTISTAVGVIFCKIMGHSHEKYQ